jgi:hypothetical protein
LPIASVEFSCAFVNAPGRGGNCHARARDVEATRDSETNTVRAARAGD